ncbi:MAG: OmpA family protein [Cytophagales bacterium]|nr:OmpA family protein [Cytophagales bacterium]MDW8384411.1 OmpA family protein [Flammeovirgaceae bacterium]
MKYKVIITIWILLSDIALAQQRRIHKMDAETRHKIAHYQMQRGSYYGAIEILEKLCEQHPNNPKYEFKLAESYFRARDYQKAKSLFENLYRKEQLSGKYSLASFYYAETLKYLGKYDSAKRIFEEYATAKRYEGKEAPTMKVFAQSEIKACEFALQMQKDTTQLYIAFPLPKTVNRGYSDFAPRLRSDNTLIFTSLQEDSLVKYRYGTSHFKHYKILQTKVNDTLWSEPIEVEAVNTYFENNGNGVFSPDGSRFYFTRCTENARYGMICHIYVAEVKNGVIQKPKKLQGSINQSNSTSTHPFVTKIKQGKTEKEILYFVSNRKGSIGGSLDIWFAIWDNKQKTFSNPQNCGRAINTIGNEISPYYVLEDSTLYFSSDFHPGLGGYDIFKIRGAGNKWEETPINIGKSLNTSYDDMFYTPIKINEEIEGFIVSNRPGSAHMRGNITCCDDIFRFRTFRPEDKELFSKPSESLLAEIFPTTLSEDSNEDSSAHEIAQKHEANADLALTDTSTENIVQEITLQEPPSDKKNSPIVETEKEQPITQSNQTETEETNNLAHPLVSNSKEEPRKQHDVPQKTNMVLEMKNKITFENAKVNLDEDDEPALKEILDYLNIYPGLIIEVGGHTDSNGSDEMNRILSIQRATAVVNALVIKYNVPRRRLKIKGYGESMPIADNQTPEGRALNRRVEFKAIQWE